MLKAYKYRIYPTEQQKLKIEQTIGCCRVVYNLALEVKICAYKSNGINLSSFDLCYQLVDLKKEYKWLKEVDSQALQAAVKKVDVAFKNYFLGIAGYPKFKSKRGKQSFQCPNAPKRIDFEKQTLTIPKNPNIPIKISREFTGEIKTITISRVSSGKYYASVLVEDSLEIPVKPEINASTTIGIDLGIKSFVVSSDGKIFDANRKLKAKLDRLKCLGRRLSRKVKGSNNQKKAIKRLSLLHEKISNQRTDYIHKTTSSLIKSDNQTFVIEDLNVAGMLKNRNLSQAISDVGFGEFARQLKYKCHWYGKSLVQIGRFEPSSKMCSNCQSINEILTLADREWVCVNCGGLHDRDLNAAKNIRQIGLNKHSGEGISGEPVEKRRLRCSKKQEIILPMNKAT